ncbi:hypothetical protein [Chryseobacterium sp. A321]
MKKHLLVYAALVILYIAYNLFFEVEDPRTNAAINILATSVLFLYIAILAFVLITKLKKNKKD